MSRALASICVVLMITGLVVISGCGSSGFTELDVDEPLVAGTQTDFIDEDGNIVAFTQFGTFKLVIDDNLVEGNYTVIVSTEGDSIEMTFDDGEIENWSIFIAEGKVNAVIDDEGTKYTQQDQLEVERQTDIDN